MHRPSTGRHVFLRVAGRVLVQVNWTRVEIVQAVSQKLSASSRRAAISESPLRLRNSMDGTASKHITVQVWKSTDAQMKWYNSAAYQAALKIGRQYPTFRRYAVEG